MKRGILRKVFSGKKKFLVFCTIILALGFFNNFWKVANEVKFKNFQKDNEALVVGRLIVAEQDGVLSNGGLTGLYFKEEDISKYKQDMYEPYMYEYQYLIYKNNLKIDKDQFFTYNSQTGGQAIIYASIGNILPISNKKKLQLFHLITSVLTALIFSLFLYWTKKEFGFYTSIAVLFLLVFSNWLTIFGRLMWWSLWAFYIPFLYLLFELGKENKEHAISLKKIFAISFFTILLKCFFNGFEYITTTLLMTMIPFVYYGILNKWKINLWFKRIFVSGLATIFAILASFLILIYQISFVKGSMMEGFKHISYSFFKRTSGDAQLFPASYKASLESSIFSVLGAYCRDAAFDFKFFKLAFWELIIVFILFSILGFLLNKKLANFYAPNYKALIFTTWIAISAPLSWFVIFKAHSFVHTHMNFIVWYMPFGLLGFILIGKGGAIILKLLFSKFKLS